MTINLRDKIFEFWGEYAFKEEPIENIDLEELSELVGLNILPQYNLSNVFIDGIFYETIDFNVKYLNYRPISSFNEFHVGLLTSCNLPNRNILYYFTHDTFFRESYYNQIFDIKFHGNSNLNLNTNHSRLKNNIPFRFLSVSK